MSTNHNLLNFEWILKSLRSQDNEKSSDVINWKLHGLLRTICTYYKYAYCSYEEYKSKCEIYLQNNEEIDKLKMEAALFGIYTNGNICLQAARTLNQHADFLPNSPKIIALRDKYKNQAKVFTLFRDNITAHPFNDKDKDGKWMKYILPHSWEQSKIDFYIFYSEKQDDEFRTISACPLSDIEFLFSYLKELGEVYKHIFWPNNSNDTIGVECK